MHLGVLIFPTDTTLQPVELARAVEERGFESLWFPEHSHIPVSRRTPWGGRAGEPPLPEHYWRAHDQFVALAAAAAVTSTLKLATGITLAAQRDPFWTAKEVASLDVISGGRVLFGVGYGWNKEEMANHGLRYTDRRAILRENVLAMKALWTEDEAEFHGQFVDFEPSWAWPKPVQKPHPPVILGGDAGPKTMQDIVEFCDGWMPIAGRHKFRDKVAALRRLAEDSGRDPDSIELALFSAPPKAAVLEGLASDGIARAVLALPQGSPGEVLDVLDSYALLLDHVGG
ncbi:MAG: LLM class F420-dependent oxidoreductase [Acidimicrobiia bacterium]|nr:LLM class F420-dependent oxidoreductase [Acidimicrobiia bacterium]